MGGGPNQVTGADLRQPKGLLTLNGGWREEQASWPVLALRVAGLWPLIFVVETGQDRCGYCPASPPRSGAKPLATPTTF